jgi:hypothetical protein
MTGKTKKEYKISVETPECKDCSENLSADRGIILKWC